MEVEVGQNLRTHFSPRPTTVNLVGLVHTTTTHLSPPHTPTLHPKFTCYPGDLFQTLGLTRSMRRDLSVSGVKDAIGSGGGAGHACRPANLDGDLGSSSTMHAAESTCSRPRPSYLFSPSSPLKPPPLARSWQGSPANHITKFSVPAFQEGRLHTTKYWLDVLVICQVFTQQVIRRWSEQLQVFFPLYYILCSDLKFLSTITAYPPLSTISLSLKSFSCSSWTINQVSEESLRDETSLWSPFLVDQSS